MLRPIGTRAATRIRAGTRDAREDRTGKRGWGENFYQYRGQEDADEGTHFVSIVFAILGSRCLILGINDPTPRAILWLLRLLRPSAGRMNWSTHRVLLF
jgi:hypothetical protein